MKNSQRTCCENRRGSLRRAGHCAVTLLGGALLGGALLAATPQVASADDPDAIPSGLQSLGHQGDGLEVKRVQESGEGMPSVLGPFPDTVNMEFLGQLTNAELGATRLIFAGSTFLSDIWGWTSPEGEEYALVGHNSGVAIARITDPENPVFLGYLPTVNPDTQLNFWWDLKTFADHLYWVSEVRGNGVGIFDLRQLDAMDGPPPDDVLEESGRYTGNGLLAAHNISINEQTGRAYLTGATKDASVDPDFVSEGMVVLQLNAHHPLQVTEVGQVLGRDTHDAQVVCYHGPDPDHQPAGGNAGRNANHNANHNGCVEIAAVFNGIDLTVGIYDVTGLTGNHNVNTPEGEEPDPIVISETSYAGASFTHQGWLTEDHAFLLMGDEEDELFGLFDPQNPDLPDTARSYVWNLQDLENPEVVSRFDSPAASIDHNLFARIDAESGREFVYHANYTAGVRVTELIRDDLDYDGIEEFAELAEVAHMDTEPRLPNNNLNFNFNIFEGPWGVFPFFPSDTIIASDGLNGLITMRLDLPPAP